MGRLQINSSDAELLHLVSTNGSNYIRFNSDTERQSAVGYFNGAAFLSNEKGNYARLAIADNGTPQYWRNNSSSTAKTLLHAGNYSSYALPLSGGTLNGTLTISAQYALRFSYIDNNMYIASDTNGLYLAAYGESNAGKRVFLETYNTGVFHRKNGADYEILTALSYPNLIKELANKNNFSAIDTSAFQIREYNFGGSQADTWGNAPRLGFHWGNRCAAQIGLASNGCLYINNNTETDSNTFYKIVVENGATWGINANSATYAYYPAGFAGQDMNSSTWGAISSADYTLYNQWISGTAGDKGGIAFLGYPTISQLSVKIDGYFFQNEGRYKVIDSSGGIMSGSLGNNGHDGILQINNTSTGNIGYHSPLRIFSPAVGTALMMIGPSNSAKNAGYIGFYNSGTSGSNSNFLTLGLYAVDNMINITGAGRVGINTTAPSQTLEVYSSGCIANFNSSIDASYVYFSCASTPKASVGYYKNFALIANEKTLARIGVNDSGIPQYWNNADGTAKYTLFSGGCGSQTDMNNTRGSYYGQVFFVI